MKKRSKKLLFSCARVAAKRAPGRKSFLLLFFKKEVLSSFALLLAGCQTNEPKKCGLAHVTDLPIHIQHGHILVPVTLNNVDMTMMLDSGAQGTSITKAAADRLGLALQFTGARVSGIGGSRSLYQFYAKTFKLGGLHGENLPLTATDMDFAGYRPAVDGLIGSDLLSHYDVDFNFGGGEVRLFKSLGGCSSPAVAMEAPLYEADLQRAPSPQDQRPFVRVVVGGKTLLAAIDSGAQGTVILRNAARRLGLRLDELKDDPHFLSSGVGPRTRNSVRHVMSPITIGEVTISNLPVAIVDDRFDDGTDMLLGMDFFAHVHVWLSFSGQMLVMQYPSKASPKLAN